MCIKRIATILFVLLGYIAIAGAMQSIIRHFVPPAPETRYAEVRVNAAKQVQVLICKNWTLKAEDAEDGYSQDEVVQDVFYWINLQNTDGRTTFADSDVHANGPVPHRSYHGTVNWNGDGTQVTINLYRTASDRDPAKATPFPGNGTYPIRKTTCMPFMQESSQTASPRT